MGMSAEGEMQGSPREARGTSTRGERVAWPGAAPLFTKETAAEHGRNGAKRSAEVRRQRSMEHRAMVASCPTCGRGPKRKPKAGEVLVFLPADPKLKAEIEARIGTLHAGCGYVPADVWPPNPQEVKKWRSQGYDVFVPG